MARARGRRSVPPTPGRLGRVRSVRTLLVGCVVASSAAAPVAAQDPDSLRVVTEPAPLVRGTIARLVLHGFGTAPLGGEAGGEPLHLTVGDDGVVRALIAAPFGDDDSLRVTLVRAATTGEAETLRLALPVAHGDYRTEQLRVAARYAAPDSAAAARIQGEVELARAVSRRAHDTPRAWSAPFRRPRPGRITSVFGTAREFNGEVASRHLGTDFAGAVGAPVYAANAGVVALTGDFYLAGHAVYLDHGGGLVTGYFHLSRVEVTPGAVVQRGQRIGRVGKSGRVTGPHLHWIARYGGITVDPMSLVRATGDER
jgi:murein DD-endopeptidase MepM/ murein hydrolase activator NlpD